MIALGLILIVVSLGVAAGVVLTTMSQAPSIAIVVGGFTITASPLAMFIAGAGCVLLLWLGLRLTVAAARRRRAQRRELKEMRRTDQAARDAAAQAQSARDHAARDQAARDQAARDQAGRDQAGQVAPPPPTRRFERPENDAGPGERGDHYS